MSERTLEYMALSELVPDERNPKAHDLEELRLSLGRWGYTMPVMIDERTGKLVAGHGRRELLLADKAAGAEPPDGVRLLEDGSWSVPVIRGWQSSDDLEAWGYIVADNRTPELGGWTLDLLAPGLEALAETPAGLGGIGYASEDLDAMLEQLRGGMEAGSSANGDREEHAGNLAERFLVPPFSVLDARQGYWQERKRAWLSLGIQSEVGRPTNLLKMSDTVLGRRKGAGMPGNAQQSLSQPRSPSGTDPSYFWKKAEAERQAGRELSNAEFEADWYAPDAYVGGTSIFDPVLCEVAYRWWCPAGGRVLDPFAGGSVRGIVAASLELAYEGVDLRPEQCAANEAQLAAIKPAGSARWLCGDALEAMPDGPFDFVFSCPPYFDLEQYSDDPADLSNAPSYEAFLESYGAAIAGAAERLADDRFACFVVGDIRDGDGIYRGFVPDTIRLFGEAGCAFYNDAILVTAVGSLALRAARIFGGARKLAKGHQNVLVFCKGDPKAAAEACAPVEVVDVASLFGEVVEAE